MKQADIIVNADLVLTMDQDLTVIRNGALAVKGSRIMDIKDQNTIRRTYSTEKVIGGPGTVALPGLINTHTHSPMVYFRGLGDDLPLKVWLEDHIWPAENAWLSYEFVSDAVELACLEMLKAGITTYNDMYFFGDAIARSTLKTGMRAVIGAGIIEFPSKTAQTTDEYFANAERFISNWKGNSLITPAIAPHALYTCGPETMIRARKLADRFDIPIHIHLSETSWEVGEIQKRYSKPPVVLLDSIGFLGRKLTAAHCVWLTDEEIDILAERKVNISHCIESNLKLASGIAPVVKMLAAGINVTFGTDSAASNNDLDILSEIATAAKVHKAVSADPTALSAQQALLMATRKGAEALGLDSVTGSLEPGKSADIVLADLKKPHLVPLYDIYSHMVYSMHSSDIQTVLVNGRIVLEDRRLTGADESEILEKARQWGEKLRPEKPGSRS